MPMNETYAVSAPSRDEVDTLEGLTLLEFGTDWCGHCRTAQPLLAQAMAARDIRHLKIEDGPGRPLGRSFRVKLWPTLILMRQGEEVARVVRPGDIQAIERLLSQAGRATDQGTS
ncbi:thioredoxin family protein [Stutzerimonas stutzeri]|uniref:thioredoxin family protein n=1 Tax=Stutzerimonas stutzeri TaxID=316 RepID=UPI00210D1DA6|nr:thioredoxin family protein [Stutzerimonas stutzeri]MCQ4319771.1 thioredoxin family protein [Stutzerimonas stutzeri]